MINRTLLNYIIILSFGCGLVQCSSVLVPNPPPKSGSRGIVPLFERLKKKTEDIDTTKKTVEQDQDSDTIDFGDAFADSAPKIVQSTTPSFSDSTYSYRHPPYRVPRKTVRVALQRHIRKASFHSSGAVALLVSGRSDAAGAFRGRAMVTCLKNGKALVETPAMKRNVTMPCTLRSEAHHNVIDFGDGSYRGQIVLFSERAGELSVINMLDMEEYLRGVVPLEIGRRKDDEIEAVKAQAVAARTYAYKQLQGKDQKPFDLLCTVADQVYGGAKVEYHEGDLAVKVTKDLVMVYENDIINAFYHSTCGGKTANVEQAWLNQKPCGYLKSVKDVDSTGKPFCIASYAYEWEETWKTKHLSSILRQTFPKTIKKSFRGSVKNLKVADRYPCGRVKTCHLITSEGKFEYGSDGIRFLLRRSSSGNPILRSARFRVISADRNTIRIKGNGYGHGVGMCQMGAIGRSKAGQKYDEILRTYYKGIEIRTAVAGE